MFVYSVEGLGLTSNATPSTETANLALRQATRAFSLIGLFLQGKGAGLTALSGLGFRVRLWTTAGSGGTAVTPSPRNDRAPASSTTAAVGTPTAGTVSGVYKLVIGCGAAGPGGWVAQHEDARIMVDAGTADELDGYSHCGTASIPYELLAEIAES
jgi:hypothetical protein